MTRETSCAGTMRGCQGKRHGDTPCGNTMNPHYEQYRLPGELVLVTGANGFVGAAVTRALLDAGARVRVLHRDGSDLRNLHGLDVQRQAGDLRDASSVRRAMRDCTYAFHVAADYRLWVPDAASMLETNVQGTRNVLEAACAEGVRRLVHTSSVATLKPSVDGRPVDEHCEAGTNDAIGPYKLSKLLAEQEVRSYVREGRLDAVICNPSTPLGPGDVKPTPTGRIIVEALRGRMPAFVDTGLNIVHVDDVAHGHVLALTRGQSGRRYILGGEDLSLARILAQAAQLCGRREPRVRLPHWLVMPVAWLSESAARLGVGGEPLATVDGVRMSRQHMFFSSRRAETELGYTHRPASHAIADAVRWFAGELGIALGAERDTMRGPGIGDSDHRASR